MAILIYNICFIINEWLHRTGIYQHIGSKIKNSSILNRWIYGRKIYANNNNLEKI